MKKVTSIAAALAICISSAAAVPRTAAQRTVEDLAGGPVLGESVVAVLAVTDKGDTLVDFNSRRMLVPASNLKLVTTGMALEALGRDWRFTTRIAHSGSIRNGVLHGDLYICGGGDPTLGSGDSIAIPLQKTFAAWKALVQKAGIKAIEGRVVGDGRWLEGPLEDDSWQWQDIGTYYGTGCCGLNFFENVKTFRVSPGKEEGDPLTIVDGYPDTPWMKYGQECSTGRKGSGDQLYLFSTELAPAGVIRGTFAQGKPAKTIECSNDFPEYTCAHSFVKYLGSHGIPCTGGPADLRTIFRLPVNETVPPDSLHILGKTLSPSLERIVFETNHASNNTYAETLFRTVGKIVSGDGSFCGAREAAKKQLTTMGLGEVPGLRMTDGSGISKKNYVSPRFLCSFLKNMLSSKSSKTYIESLPHPGGNGTLKGRLPSSDDALKERVRMKSGSMDGVRCFSGYILPVEDDAATVVFSILINNCTAPTSGIGACVDRIIVSLARD